ncbi:MAG: hypothetical protein L0I92_01695 [Staphylococcus equorum]|nr:hypothetical protein [Staphylococcus equorum]
MTRETEYRDSTPVDFPDDYERTDIDPRVARRTNAVRQKQYGKDVRESMAQAEEITSVIANQARNISQDVGKRQGNVEQRFDDQIAGSTNDDEVIDARNSNITGETSKTLKVRLDGMEENSVHRTEDKATYENASIGTDDNTYMTPHSSAVAIQNQLFKGEGASVHYIAHRGSNKDFPENSMMAFEAVTRHWGIETDISVTKDGHWVIMHDDTVDRMTNGTGAIAGKTLDEIKKLRIDTGTNLNALSDKQKQIPTLNEYLAICKRRGVVPVIEIKAGSYTAANYDTLVENLKQFHMVQGVMIISYSLEALQEMKKRLPLVPMQFLVNSITGTILNQAQDLGINSGISVKYNHQSVTAENVRKAHDRDLSVCVYTVPDTRFEEVIDLGVDFITTDSKSGDLRYAKLDPVNGFVINNNHGMHEVFVEEMAGGRAHLYFVVRGGTNNRFDVLLRLPEWATPVMHTWESCLIKVKNNVTTLASFDVMGNVGDGNNKPGDVRVSYGWEQREGWAAGNVIYPIY